MLESVQLPQPTVSSSLRTPTTESDCREARPVKPTTIASDLLDIFGGAILGLVLMVILIP